MSKLQELISSLTSSETIVRFKELEKVIDHNENLKQEFALLLSLQKIMVQKEHNKDKTIEEAIKNYETQKEKVLNYLIVNEYLELLEEINSDLALIQSIIEQEINIDFDLL